jgi:3-hydroxyisobutyrate dehydrogenase
MTSVGFVGLGAMGSPMAMNLHTAGFRVKVFNRDPSKRRLFAEKGIEVTDSPAAAARGAEFVVSIVSDDAATREVMLGASGILSTAAAGTVILDSSTNTPGMAREVAKAAAARDVAYLDAPVTGSVVQARNGELVFMVGGPQVAFEHAGPLFAAMGRMARRMGESGTGATIKLINNMLTAALQAALAEAALVAEAAGLDRAAAVEVLGEGAAGSRAVKTKLPKMFKRDFSAQFQLELMDKDLRYFLALAQELDCPAPLASLVRSQYQAARRGSFGKLDACAVFLHAAGEKK